MSSSALPRITVAWGVVFALVHFYWAADEPDLGAGLYIAFIAVLALVGAVVAHRRMRRLALLGATALLLGVVFGVAGWIADGSLNGDGAEGVIITAYFLLGGILYARLGIRASGGSSLPLDARST